ncbi:MAG: SAM-dependent chlorinase/fluorinase [Actinobacteria bacterium]|nr:SAM-dependent chlorinase/fluorinase [Actinomycetota bacterium]
MSRYDTVTFLSDYGRVDEFVGVVHSVIRSIAPHAGIIDLTHDVAPYDVRAAGLVLARSAQYLCPGVVLAVVDPGVGTDRRPIAVEVGGGQSVLVGPDNGVLAPAVAMVGGASRAVVLDDEQFHLPSPGPTFAGRDVFAPVVGNLCAGTPFEALGTAIDPLSLRPALMNLSRIEGDGVEGEVLWEDRYGNLQLNIDPDDVEAYGERITVRLGDRIRMARRVRTYAEIRTGELGLVVDSYGMLALVADRASAAGELRIGAGDPVRLESAPDDNGADGVTVAVELGTRRQP